MSDDKENPPSGTEEDLTSPFGEEEAEELSFKNVDVAEGEYLDPLMQAMEAPNSGRDLESVYDIPIKVSAILGNARMKVKNIMKMRKGEVVELDRSVGDAIDIWVNNCLVARGEVVVVGDRLGITMTEIIKTDKSQA